MSPYLIGALIAAGGTGLYLFWKGGSSGALTPVQQAQQAANNAAAGNYDAQSQALGIPPDAAQYAFGQGLTPSEAAGAGYTQQGGGSGNGGGGGGWGEAILGGAAGSALAMATMSAGPLTFHGETEASTGAPIYRTRAGEPVLVDDLGDTWTFSEGTDG